MINMQSAFATEDTALDNKKNKTNRYNINSKLRLITAIEQLWFN